MSSDSNTYIAGVGFSHPSSGGSSEGGKYAILISAATEALLDAGLTYDDVTSCTSSKELKDASAVFKSSGEEDININEAVSGSKLQSSLSQIEGTVPQCVLLIAAEKSGATALVLTSEHFLWQHPYLRDSAISIRKSTPKGEKSNQLQKLCQIVWPLRGWIDGQDNAGKEESLHFQGKSDQGFTLSRADRKSIPRWKEVEYRQDGKHRLRHNPAVETKDISREDFEAVRSETARKKGELNQQQGKDIMLKRKGGDRASLARL